MYELPKLMLAYFHWVLIVTFPVILSLILAIANQLLGTSIDADLKFDFIIVGGGASGSILANRLSETGKYNVLVVEAGSKKPQWLNIPALGPLHQLTELDWQYKTVPQQHGCYALRNNRSVWPLGKVLGGSTHLNYMLFIPGFPEDFALWKDQSSKHWSRDDISYYFKKLQKELLVPVRDTLYSTSLSDTLLLAAAQLGFSVNSSTGIGFFKPKLNVNRDGSRWTSDQLIQPTNRPNVKVLTNCQAQQILLVDQFEAHGISMNCRGTLMNAYADKEVIVSAGTIGSAQLLMLSGIGPADSLTPAGVPVHHELPVGHNLQDHVTTGLDLLLLQTPIFSMHHLTSFTAAWDYYVKGRGAFTSALCEAVGLVHTPLVNPQVDLPDIQLMAMMAGVSSDGGFFSRHTLGIKDTVWDEFYAVLVKQSVATILPVVLHPKSRGTVLLDPDHPQGQPRIDPDYLSHPHDVATLVEGVKMVKRLSEAPAMQNLGVRFNSAVHPGCEDLKFDSQDYWECYVRQVTLTSYHPVGSCAIGSVVDHRLRVYNTNKLRVIDASVMSSLPSGNTNAAVMMVALKGADLILEDQAGMKTRCYLTQMFLPNTQCFVN